MTRVSTLLKGLVTWLRLTIELNKIIQVNIGISLLLTLKKEK